MGLEFNSLVSGNHDMKSIPNMTTYRATFEDFFIQLKVKKNDIGLNTQGSYRKKDRVPRTTTNRVIALVRCVDTTILCLFGECRV